MIGRRLSRLASATTRSHSGCTGKPDDESLLPATALKKLVKTSASAPTAAIKRHSCEPLVPSVPVSETIRTRILKSGARFHCNDNICEFVREDELPLLVDEVAQQMQGVLKSVIRPILQLTAQNPFHFLSVLALTRCAARS